MLVLSRRPEEKIFFPNSHVTIQVVAIKPGMVRLGIEAPPHVPVFRQEVWDRDPKPVAVEASPDLAFAAKLRELNHAVRNRCNAVSIGLALLRRQLQAGPVQACEATLDRIIRDLQSFQKEIEGTVQQMASPPQPPARLQRRALLVEDDRNECELLAGFLRIAGVDVATAGDGADALDYLRNQGRPDIVLLDMVLPRCDGPTTIRAIRSNPAYAGLKIFAVSGHAPEEFDLESGPAGVDRWFRKPLNPELLLQELHRELNQP